MSQASKPSNSWQKSKLVNQPEPSTKDLVPWSNLSVRRRRSFVQAYMAADAQTARKHALKPLRVTEHDQLFSTFLALYWYSVRHDLSEQTFFEKVVKDLIFFKFAKGEWKSLDWLLSHCRTKYPKGLLSGEAEEWIDNSLHSRMETSDTIEATMLRVFSRITGIDLLATMFQAKFAEPFEDPEDFLKGREIIQKAVAGESLPMPTIFPKGLPTKAYLDSETLKEWRIKNPPSSKERIRKENGEQQSAELLIARLRKKLGLQELPKASRPKKRARRTVKSVR